MPESHVVDGVFDKIESTAENADTVSVADLLDTFAERIYGPVIFTLGVIALSPIGAIPGASIILGTLVIVFAVQYAVTDKPWAPDALRAREVDAEKVGGSLSTMRPYAKKIEFLFAERAVSLTRAPWTFLWSVTLVALSLSMYPLALIPGGVFAPALAITAIGLAITARDGRALAIGAGLGWLAILGAAFAII